jgi:hypothetical protein
MAKDLGLHNSVICEKQPEINIRTLGENSLHLITLIWMVQALRAVLNWL